MRILRVAQKVYPDVTGGGPYHVHAMSRDQAAMGHDVTVLTVSPDSKATRWEERDGYTVVHLPTTVEVLGNWISTALGDMLYHASDYDVVHAHSHLYFSTNLAALKRAMSDTPLAITNHGLYSQTAAEWIFDLYLRTIGRMTFNAADVVFCYTDEEERMLRRFGVNSAIDVVPNGIDQTRFSPQGPTIAEIEDGEPSIVFVGRLVEGKRPGVAVEAMERLIESHPDARLFLVGDGPLREDLRRSVVESGIQDSVRFLGHIGYEEMPRVYRSADALVLPSRTEGLPRTVLESLSTETPVVTSDLAQLRPITSEAGFSVPVGDVDGFTDALRSLASDPPLRRTLGKRGRETVTERFTWEETVRATTDGLRRVARGSDPAGTARQDDLTDPIDHDL